MLHPVQRVFINHLLCAGHYGKQWIYSCELHAVPASKLLTL